MRDEDEPEVGQSGTINFVDIGQGDNVPDNMVRIAVRKTKYYPKLIEMVGVCEICHSRNNLVVHHIQRLIDGGKDIPRNIQIVCRKCHSDLHAHQGRRV